MTILCAQDSLEGKVINPEFVVFNDTGHRFELLMKVSGRAVIATVTCASMASNSMSAIWLIA